MQITGNTCDGYEIRLTRAELDVLRNCLNETARGIAIAEFETRVGATVEDGEQLLEVIAQADRS